MRVLVTGASGYIGGTLVPLLVDLGHSVRVLDLEPWTGRVGQSASNAEFTPLIGDVGDPVVLASALRDIDAVVHLAAVVGYPACDAAPRLAHSINVNAVRTLLRARDPHTRLVLASTASVYGRVRDGVCDESSPCTPVSTYGRTKLMGESAVLAADNTTALRFTTAFGVGPVTRLDLLLHRLSIDAMLDGEIALYEPHAVRSFVHVMDIARSIVLALDSWSDVVGRVLNVGSGSANHSKLELASAIADKTGAVVRIAEGQDADCRDYRISFDRIESLGFSPSLSALDGVDEIITLIRNYDESTLRRAGRLVLDTNNKRAVVAARTLEGTS